MRLTADEVRVGLLHPEPIVRDAALAYFADGYSPDPTILPTVAQAMERYGRVGAFFFPALFRNLAVPDEMAEWAVYQLSLPQAADEDPKRLDCLRTSLAELLEEADPSWLAARGPDVIASGVMNEVRGRDVVERVVAHAALDGVQLWRQLQKMAVRHCTLDEWHEQCFQEGLRFVSLLARQGERHAGHMMALLEQRCDDYTGDPFAWMELFAVELAGRLRYEPAIPLLVPRLLEGVEHDDDGLVDGCEIALVRIGGDAVVRSILDQWPETEYLQRFSLARVLESIHTDLASDGLCDLLRGERDEDVRAALAAAALRQFSREAVELARDEPDQTPLGNDYKHLLVASCLLLGIEDPRLERWQEEVARLREATKHALDLRDSPWVDRAIPVFEDGDYADGEWEREDDPDYLPPVEPIRAQKTAGRNDPCPCGSGKKFKKCCLRKGSLTE